MQALFVVCGHLQDPSLYQPSCVGRCIVGPDGGLVACDDFAPGTLLTLFPIHAFGCAEVAVVGATVEETCPGGEAVRLYLPLLDEATYAYPAFHGRRADLFVDATVSVGAPGWLAHRAEVVDGPEHRANCMTVPLGGAAPLSALVATTHVRSGEALRLDGSTRCMRTLGSRVGHKKVTRLARQTTRRYADEIGELRGYLDMAYQATEGSAAVDGTAAAAAHVELPPSCDDGFHSVARDYPRLHALRAAPGPEVLMVRDFLTADECDRLVPMSRRSPRWSQVWLAKAAQAAGWIETGRSMGGAWGSLRRDLALREASGEPAGRSQV